MEHVADMGMNFLVHVYIVCAPIFKLTLYPKPLEAEPVILVSYKLIVSPKAVKIHENLKLCRRHKYMPPNHIILIYERPFGTCQNCHCNRGVTVTAVTVSGEVCITVLVKLLVCKTSTPSGMAMIPRAYPDNSFKLKESSGYARSSTSTCVR